MLLYYLTTWKHHREIAWRSVSLFWKPPGIQPISELTAAETEHSQEHPRTQSVSPSFSCFLLLSWDKVLFSTQSPGLPVICPTVVSISPNKIGIRSDPHIPLHEKWENLIFYTLPLKRIFIFAIASLNLFLSLITLYCHSYCIFKCILFNKSYHKMQA